jgi:hypothetical protein
VKAVLAACALLGGCALLQPPPPKPVAAPLGFHDLLPALSIGESTKADVRAAFGDPVAVDFPSGYEIWVYREKSPTRSAELVLLFDPSGILAKTRVR